MLAAGNNGLTALPSRARAIKASSSFRSINSRPYRPRNCHRRPILPPPLPHNSIAHHENSSSNRRLPRRRGSEAKEGALTLLPPSIAPSRLPLAEDWDESHSRIWARFDCFLLQYASLEDESCINQIRNINTDDFFLFLRTQRRVVGKLSGEPSAAATTPPPPSTAQPSSLPAITLLLQRLHRR